VGADAFEEVNEGVAGANYGWPMTEGPSGARGCAPRSTATATTRAARSRRRVLRSARGRARGVPAGVARPLLLRGVLPERDPLDRSRVTRARHRCSAPR
jgi:hypothetical protein